MKREEITRGLLDIYYHANNEDTFKLTRRLLADLWGVDDDDIYCVMCDYINRHVFINKNLQELQRMRWRLDKRRQRCPEV